ncbi:MAG TPA: hydrolase [Gammaproteobacteria bacterium]|nr:hydrolase [Gammaproteobacteria bacterium]
MSLQSSMKFLEQNQQQMLDLTIKLAEINSGSFHIAGLKAVAEVMRQEMAVLNCEHITMPVAPLQLINQSGETVEYALGDVVRFWKRPDAPIQVLILGHMDTVYSPDHKFKHITQLGSDLLHGPGVTDMKGGLAILLWALKAFEQLPQAKNLGWEVLLNSDEEIGSPGSAEIIAFRAKQHRVGFVFEPAMDESGTLAGERKGSGTFTLVMRGKAAHAGRNFNEGRNAVCKMAEVITTINALNGKRSGVTINIGFVHGGEAVNVVPDCCVCRLNVRVPHMDDATWMQEELNAIVRAFKSVPDYKLELHGGFHRYPKELDPTTQHLYSIVKNVGKNLDLNITWEPSGGCSDGNNLAAVGLPNVDTLGVRGGKIHSEQEFMIIPSLVERAQLFTNILVYLSENGFTNGT